MEYAIIYGCISYTAVTKKKQNNSYLYRKKVQPNIISKLGVRQRIIFMHYTYMHFCLVVSVALLFHCIVLYLLWEIKS